MPVVVPSLVVVVLMRVVVVVADRGHACLYNGTIWLHKYSSRCRFVVVAHTILPCYVATYSMNGNSRIASCPNRRTACSAVGLTWIFNDGGRKKWSWCSLQPLRVSFITCLRRFPTQCQVERDAITMVGDLVDAAFFANSCCRPCPAALLRRTTP